MKRKSKIVSSWYVLLLLSVITYSCMKDDINAPQSTAISEVQFTLGLPADSGGRTGNENEASDIASLLITIKNEDGTSVYTQEQLEVYEFSGEFISEPISLNVDDYQLTEFYALDGEGNAIFASPLEGSELAELVDDPLAIDFEVTEDNVTKLTPGLVSTANASAADFGYAAFGFDIVQYFEIQLAVMAYSEEDDNYVLVKSELNVEGDGDVISEKSLDAVTEEIKIKDGYNEYTLSISSNGYEDLTYTFSADSLKGYEGNDPLIVVLEGKGNQLDLDNKLYGIGWNEDDNLFFGYMNNDGEETVIKYLGLSRSDVGALYQRSYDMESGLYTFTYWSEKKENMVFTVLDKNGDIQLEIEDGDYILRVDQLRYNKTENKFYGVAAAIEDPPYYFDEEVYYFGSIDWDGNETIINHLNAKHTRISSPIITNNDQEFSFLVNNTSLVTLNMNGEEIAEISINERGKEANNIVYNNSSGSYYYLLRDNSPPHNRSFMEVTSSKEAKTIKEDFGNLLLGYEYATFNEANETYLVSTPEGLNVYNIEGDLINTIDAGMLITSSLHAK